MKHTLFTFLIFAGLLSCSEQSKSPIEQYNASVGSGNSVRVLYDPIRVQHLANGTETPQYPVSNPIPSLKNQITYLEGLMSNDNAKPMLSATKALTQNKLDFHENPSGKAILKITAEAESIEEYKKSINPHQAYLDSMITVHQRLDEIYFKEIGDFAKNNGIEQNIIEILQ